ncbi:hypothetical protein ACP275_02G055500 [Erythranthe tilingii]
MDNHFVYQGNRMEHPFFTATATRTEALRWLTIAEQLLSARDLLGSKSFATRARDSEPALVHTADEILAVADTLIAGDRRVSSNQHDWYAILRLTPQQGRDAELVDNQYRSLALILNPRKNRFPFAEQAFHLVVNAWSFLSDPSRKSLYDTELIFGPSPPPPPQQQQHQPNPFSDPIPTLQQNFNFFGGGASSNTTQPPPPLSHGGESRTLGATSFPQVQQVHAFTQVGPAISGSTHPPREPQNFMSFPSGSNFVFGSGSVSHSKSGPAPVNNHAQESYSTFTSHVASASEPNQEQLNNQQKQPQENHSNVSDNKTIHNENPIENVGEIMEDEVDVETIDEDEDLEEEEVERFDSPANEEEDEIFDSPANEEEGSTFWTACPYCYYMYEYPVVYTDCTLRCQNCKSAFQAVVIPSPPPTVDGQDGYFCCWAFFPLGYSMENWEKNKGASSSWSPFSPMFTSPRNGKKKPAPPRVYIDDDDDFLEISSSSESDDDDWRNGKGKKIKKKAKRVPSRNVKIADKGKNTKAQDERVESSDRAEIPVKTAFESRKQPGRVVKSSGKLDLNVEFCNEAEESAPRKKEGNGPGHGVEDNIEGIGFFEGLDEFLSSLPILNAVGDDKAVKAA